MLTTRLPSIQKTTITDVSVDFRAQRILSFGHRQHRYCRGDRPAERYRRQARRHEPWTVHNTFFAWGVDFKRGATVHLPVSNVDVTPTLLALGFDHDSTLPRLDGRAITEAFVDGPDEQQIPLQTKTYVTAKQDRRYRAAFR